MDENRSRWSRELSPRTQLVALLALWAVWGAAAVYVVVREQILEEQCRHYDDPGLVYSLLLFWEPLPLIVLGLLFVQRLKARAEGQPPNRVTRLLVAILTLAGALVVVSGVAACLVMPMRFAKIRE